MQEVANPTGFLRQIFPVGAIAAVCDDASLGGEVSQYGLRYVPIDNVATLPAGSNVVLFLSRHLISKRIRVLFKDHRVLVVPIASFDAAPEPASYTLRMTTLTDYVEAADTAAYWIDQLRSGAKHVIFGPLEPGESAASTRLECSLGQSLTVDAWPRAEIAVGDWVSVGSCCELSITQQPGMNSEDVFSIDGTAQASGVLVARDPRCTEAGDARIHRAKLLREEMTDRGSITLSLIDNVLTSVCAGGKDFTTELLEVTNPDYGLQALELGIGTNLSLLPKVDWRYNSQLNEGAGAMHIGFGEGVTGAHMDFVIAESEHHFLP